MSAQTGEKQHTSEPRTVWLNKQLHRVRDSHAATEDRAVHGPYEPGYVKFPCQYARAHARRMQAAASDPTFAGC